LLVKTVEEISAPLDFDLESHTTLQFNHVIEALAPLFLETDLDTFSPGDNLSAIENDAAEQFWQDARLQGRSFCTTKQNRICSCMNKIETGDVIAAFRGGDRLYVLRPAEDGRYRVVGDVYVHGLMNGEAYDGLDPDEVDYDIELI
jgi:hypothetical protein